MALSELVALETAYRALQPLEPAARRRGLRWLRDALEVPAHLPEQAERARKSGYPETKQVPVVDVPEGSGAFEPSGEVSADPVGEQESAGEAAQSRLRGTARRSSGRRRSARSRTSNDETGKERVYRRMPPAEDVLRAYRQVGTISGLADYFSVPRHTVQGWARRLRSAGYVIGRGA